MNVLTITIGFVLAVEILHGQILIDTFAGGKLPPDIQAQNIPLGQISGLTRDPSGHVVFAENNIIRRIRDDGKVETIAGTGITGFSGDGGPATSAQLSYAGALRFDTIGNLYFADTSWRVRRIDTTGKISTVAGTGIPNSNYELPAAGIPATSTLIGLGDLAVDSQARLYLAEGQMIRRLTASGTLEVIAGIVDPACIGFDCSDGDGGPATSAHISDALIMTFDAVDNLYIAQFDGRIRRISPDGVIHQFAGYTIGNPLNQGDGGPALTAYFPGFITALGADASGNVYVTSGQRIRRIGTNGIVNTVAGGGLSGDGPATQTLIRDVPCLVAGGTDDVYFCDNMSTGEIPYSGINRIRELTPLSLVQTIAGGAPKSAPDGVALQGSWLASPGAVAFSRNGDLYVAEREVCTVRRIGSDGIVATVAGTGHCGTTAPSGTATATDLPPITSIAMDSQDRLYFSNTFGVYLILGGGSIIPATPNPPGSFARLAIDSQDRIYLSVGNFLSRIASVGATREDLNWTGAGFFPGAIAIDRSDNVYVVNDGNQFKTLYRFDQTGKATGLVSLFSPTPAIAVDTTGTVWGINNGYGVFRIIGTSKENVTSWGGFSGDGGPALSAQVYISNGLAFAPDGDLYIADQGNNRIRRIYSSPPNVAGLTRAAAATAITGAGLVMGTVKKATSTTVPIGSVISESPAAGVSANLGTPVNLVISGLATKVGGGVFRNGFWAVDTNRNWQWDASDKYTWLGQASDIPIMGDFDGDGVPEMGIFRDGFWAIDMNHNGVWDVTDKYVYLGQAGDVPVVGDFNGDGISEMGVFRNGFWAIDMNHDGIWEANDKYVYLGQAGDVPVVGDLNGDGISEMGVFRSGFWAIDMNHDGIWEAGDKYVYLGQAGDVPVVGDFGDGISEMGIFRSGFWAIDLNRDGIWEADDGYYFLGQAGDVPIIGAF